MRSKLENLGSLTLESNDKLKSFALQMRLSQTECASKQRNFSLGLQLLRHCQANVTQDASDTLRWTHTYAKVHHSRMLHSEAIDKEQLTTIAKCYNELGKC